MYMTVRLAKYVAVNAARHEKPVVREALEKLLAVLASPDQIPRVDPMTDDDAKREIEQHIALCCRAALSPAPSHMVFCEDEVNAKRYLIGPFSTKDAAENWALADGKEKLDAGEPDDYLVNLFATESCVELHAQDEVAYRWTVMEAIAP